MHWQNKATVYLWPLRVYNIPMEKLIEILSELHPDIDFAIEDNLIERGILDSFDIVTLIAEIYDAYGVTIKAEYILPENFKSAEALWQLITNLSENDW